VSDSSQITETTTEAYSASRQFAHAGGDNRASGETAPFVSICRRFLRDVRHAYTPDARELNTGRGISQPRRVDS
jgi:hypothetical protein